MTSLIINRPAANLNTVLSLSNLSSFGEKASGTKSFMTYTATPKNWYRKSPVKFFSIDWDVNMNELEFE